MMSLSHPARTLPVVAAVGPRYARRMADSMMARLSGRLAAFAAALSSPSAAQRKDLTAVELRDRVDLHSPLLIKELYESALRQIQHETARQTRLDGKATSLLTATGLSLTVAFAFGGQILMTNADKLKSLNRYRPI
jgi:hypothetical protein